MAKTSGGRCAHRGDLHVQPLSAGALAATTAEDAYFVRCDRTTMTQDDIDNGRLVIVVGFAPHRPAEFLSSGSTRVVGSVQRVAGFGKSAGASALQRSRRPVPEPRQQVRRDEPDQQEADERRTGAPLRSSVSPKTRSSTKLKTNRRR